MTMTREERNAEVVRCAANLGMDSRRIDANAWALLGPDGLRGVLSYNQRSGIWKASGGAVRAAKFGSFGGMLNLLACTRANVVA